MGRRVKLTQLKAILPIAALLLLLGSCGNGLLDWVKTTTQKTGYLGWYSDGTQWVPFYTKGNTRTDLPGSVPLAGSLFVNGWMTSGDTTYIGGNYWKGPGTGNVACYWTIKGGNATRTDLAGDPGYIYSARGGSTFSGGTLYICGVWMDALGNSIPCYWVGTQRVDFGPIGPPGHLTEAGEIWVDSNGKVSLSGWYYDGVSEVPCYWPSPTSAPIPLPVPNLQVSWPPVWGLWVLGSTVYVTGTYTNGAGIKVGFYWTITQGSVVRTDLPGDGVHDVEAWWSNVSTGTVYTDGHYSDGTKWIPCYWVGAIRVDLTGNSGNLTHSASSGGWTYLPDKILTDGETYDGQKNVISLWTVQNGSVTGRTDYSANGVYDTHGGVFYY